MIPVLDKGHVALLGKTMDGLAVQSLIFNFNAGVFDSKFLDIPVMALNVKCPLFVQLWLMENGIKVIPQRNSSAIVEAYIPSVPDLKIADLSVAEEVQQSIAHTTEALLLNPKGYQMDGCERFISQIISPISVYNTLVAYGSLNAWLEITERKGLLGPIDEYRKAIKDVVHSEWAVIKPWLRRKM